MKINGQVHLKDNLPMDKDYFTAPHHQENVVLMVLAESVKVSQQAVERMNELRYGEDECYKMTLRKMDSLGDRKVFRPVQVRYTK